MEHIKVLDKNGKCNNWIIEYDTKDYYEVFHKCFITILRKDKCSTIDGEIVSSEVRSFEEYSGMGGRHMGSERCVACGKKVYNLNSLRVLVDTDKYVCRKCAERINDKTRTVGN